MLYRGAARAVDAVTGLSRAAAAQVALVLGREAEVLPPGVRMDRFPLAAEARTGPPTILFSADAGDPRKGVHFLLAAFGRLLDRFPDATLQISGVGSHEWAVPGLGDDGPRILERVRALGTGSPEDVPRRYREATVTVLPSLNEAFGLALVESLASGTPVVCADHGGMPEIVHRDDIGRTFPSGDVVALAKAIEEVVELAADPSTPARCREHAANWGWDEAVGAAHERLYERVAG
jgi:glycosyltransferase involved in cell wall biosynthesis